MRCAIPPNLVAENRFGREKLHAGEVALALNAVDAAKRFESQLEAARSSGNANVSQLDFIVQRLHDTAAAQVRATGRAQSESGWSNLSATPATPTAAVMLRRSRMKLLGSREWRTRLPTTGRLRSSSSNKRVRLRQRTCLNWPAVFPSPEAYHLCSCKSDESSDWHSVVGALLPAEC